MNERLHQLMRQAQSKAYANACAKKKTQSPQNNTVWNEFPEVFAELIVKECAHLVGGYVKEDEFGTDVKEAYEEITKHFGVE